jgi:hypothetical protein
MEKALIEALLEKYWQAETTIEEEQALAAYFRGPNVAPELEQYADVFAYFDEELKITPSPDLEARILQTIQTTPFRWGLLSAAAAIVILFCSIFLLTPATQKPNTIAAKTTIHDTYDDPEKALAAVRHALLIASAHLNEGRQQVIDPNK